ncbi:MAG: T9SS type A sorting domain-containing protein [Bacteroidia bacterium]
MNKTSTFLALFFLNYFSSLLGQNPIPPFSIYNSYGTVGDPQRLRDAANTSANIYAWLPVSHYYVAVSWAGTANGYNWVGVNVPGTGATAPALRYTAYGYGNPPGIPCEEQMLPQGSGNFILDINSTLTIRSAAGTGNAAVTIGGAAAKVFNGQKYRWTGATATASGFTWYRIYLPDNCSQTMGWIADVAGTAIDVIGSSLQAIPVPTGLTCSTLSTSSIYLNWNNVWFNCSPIQYQVYRNGVLIATTTTSAYTDNGLAPGTSYTYNIRAIYNSFYSANVTTSCATVGCSVAASGISGVSSLCAGQSTSLSVTGGSLANGANWAWYSGGCGGTYLGSGSSISVSPTANTNYFVRAEGAGCANTACVSHTITMNSNSTAASSINGNTNILSGNSTSLSVVGGSLGTGASWQWYSGSCGGTYVGSGSSINLSPSTTTTYYVRAAGTCNTTSCTSITINVSSCSSAPTGIGGNAYFCSGQSTTLSVQGGNLGTGASWKWYKNSCGGTLVGTGSSISVSPSSTATYYVRAEGGLCGITTACASKLLTITSSPVAATGITGNTSIVAGNPTTLTIQGGTLGAGSNWKWYTSTCGGTLVGTGVSKTFYPTSTTTYYARAEGACGNTACVSFTVNVVGCSVAPTGISGPVGLCPGQSTTLSVAGGSLGTGASWKWYKGACGGTLVGTGSSIVVSPTTSTAYFVRAEGGACGTTACAGGALSIYNNSTAPTSISGTTTITAGASTTLSVNGGNLGLGAAWKWYNGTCGGNLVGTGASISVTPTSTTTYFVRAEGNCNNTGCVSVTVTANANIGHFPACTNCGFINAFVKESKSEYNSLTNRVYDNGTNVPTEMAFSWYEVERASSYEIYFSDNNNAKIGGLSYISAPSFVLANNAFGVKTKIGNRFIYQLANGNLLQQGQTYKYKIIAKNAGGTVIACSNIETVTTHSNIKTGTNCPSSNMVGNPANYGQVTGSFDNVASYQNSVSSPNWLQRYHGCTDYTRRFALQVHGSHVDPVNGIGVTQMVQAKLWGNQINNLPQLGYQSFNNGDVMPRSGDIFSMGGNTGWGSHVTVIRRKINGGSNLEIIQQNSSNAIGTGSQLNGNTVSNYGFDYLKIVRPRQMNIVGLTQTFSQANTVNFNTGSPSFSWEQVKDASYSIQIDKDNGTCFMPYPGFPITRNSANVNLANLGINLTAGTYRIKIKAHTVQNRGVIVGFSHYFTIGSGGNFPTIPQNGNLQPFVQPIGSIVNGAEVRLQLDSAWVNVGATRASGMTPFALSTGQDLTGDSIAVEASGYENMAAALDTTTLRKGLCFVPLFEKMTNNIRKASVTCITGHFVTNPCVQILVKGENIASFRYALPDTAAPDTIIWQNLNYPADSLFGFTALDTGYNAIWIQVLGVYGDTLNLMASFVWLPDSIANANMRPITITGGTELIGARLMIEGEDYGIINSLPIQLSIPNYLTGISIHKLGYNSFITYLDSFSNTVNATLTFRSIYDISATSNFTQGVAAFMGFATSVKYAGTGSISVHRYPKNFAGVYLPLSETFALTKGNPADNTTVDLSVILDTYSDLTNMVVLIQRTGMPDQIVYPAQFSQNNLFYEANFQLLKVGQLQGNEEVTVVSALSSALPIELISLKADYWKETQTLVHWQTQQDQGIAEFEVEHDAFNTNQFEYRGTVIAKGGSDKHLYQWIDEKPVNGMNYYRLKMIDSDGKYEYSPIVSLHFESQFYANIYPNPVTESLNIDVSGSIGENIQISIYAVDGKLIHKQSKELASTHESIKISTLDWASGIYFVNISGNSGRVYKKVVKE